MSTKVYFAWRCHLKDFTRARDFLREKIWKSIQTSLHTFAIKSPKLDLDLFIEIFGGAGLNIFIDQDSDVPRAYIIFYGSDRWVPKRLPRWIEEFSYWDNSDHPKKFSYEQWKARGKVWDRIAFDNERWTTHRMSLEILSKYNSYRLLPIIQKVRREQKRST